MWHVAASRQAWEKAVSAVEADRPRSKRAHSAGAAHRGERALTSTADQCISYTDTVGAVCAEVPTVPAQRPVFAYLVVVGVSLPIANCLTAPQAMGAACALASEEVLTTLCYPADTFWKRPPALALYIPAVAYAYIGISVVMDDHLLPATERLCEALGVDAGVANQVIIAGGSSATEVAALLEWAVLTDDLVWVTFLVAVALFRLLMLIGTTAVVSPQPVRFCWPLLLRDTLAAAIVLATTAVAVFVPVPSANCGYWWEGLTLLVLYAAYVAFLRWGNTLYLAACARRWPSVNAAAPAAAAAAEPPDGRLSYADATAGTNMRVLARRLAATPHPGGASTAGGPDATAVSVNGGEPPSAPVSGSVVVAMVHLRLWMVALGLKLWRLLCWPWRGFFWLTHPPVTRDDPWQNWWPLTLGLAICWVYGLMYVVLLGSRMLECMVDIPLVNPREMLYTVGTSPTPPCLSTSDCLVRSVGPRRMSPSGSKRWLWRRQSTDGQLPQPFASCFSHSRRLPGVNLFSVIRCPLSCCSVLPLPCAIDYSGASFSDLGAAIRLALDKRDHGQSIMASILASTVNEFGLGLGAALLLSTLIRQSPQYFRTGPAREVVFSWVMLGGSAVVLLALLAGRQWKLERWLGWLLVSTYGAYVVYIFIITR